MVNVIDKNLLIYKIRSKQCDTVMPHLPGLKNRCTAVSAESVATYSNQSLGEDFGGRRFTKQSDIRLKKSKIQS